MDIRVRFRLGSSTLGLFFSQNSWKFPAGIWGRGIPGIIVRVRSLKFGTGKLELGMEVTELSIFNQFLLE